MIQVKMDEAVKTQYKLLIDRFGKMIWTHKIQEKQADIYMRKAKWLKTKMAFWTVLTTTSAIMVAINQILQVLNCEWAGNIITALFAGISSYYVLRYKDESYESKAKENKNYAAKCRRIRNEYESLLTDIKSDRVTNLDEIARRRDILEKDEDTLFSGEIAPHTSPEAYKEAEKALKQNKEAISEQDELASIIPENLRIED